MKRKAKRLGAEHFLRLGNRVWITVGQTSVRIATDEAGSIRVTVFRVGEEDGDPIAESMFIPAYVAQAAGGA